MTLKRFEGTFVLAPSGSGKSTALLYSIMSDLAYVERGEASVIVMDDRGYFLRDLETLETFHTGPLKDKLIIIEPSIERPFPLNPFALKKGYKGDAGEKYENAAIELIAHIFSTVGDEAKFTPRQRILFLHCVRLCMKIPDASIVTLQEIFTTKSVEPYAKYVERLEPEHRHFFEHQFTIKGPKGFQEVCTELMWRLSGVLENTTLTRMLSAPASLDFFTELNAGKFIIVNTNRDLLGGEKASVLGRVIIALVRLAMRERDPIPEKKRLPAYFYIDEAHIYLDNDTQVAFMIDDVRASRLGMTFATQSLDKFDDPKVRGALLRCSIQMARPVSTDFNAVASAIHADPKFLPPLRDRQFYLYIRDEHPADAMTVPEFHMRQFRHHDPLWTEKKKMSQELVVVPQLSWSQARDVKETVIDAEYEQWKEAPRLTYVHEIKTSNKL